MTTQDHTLAARLAPLVPFCAGPFRVDPHSHWIMGVDVYGSSCHILDIRGWGYLTGGGRALNLPSDVAMQAKVETAQWVVDALNMAWNTRSNQLITTAEADERVKAAVVAEREACAWTATSFLVGDPKNGIPLRGPMASEVAAAIRARGAKP